MEAAEGILEDSLTSLLDLLDTSEKWSESVIQRQSELEDDEGNSHYNLKNDALEALSSSFGSMLIELDTERSISEEVAGRIEAGKSEEEIREGYLSMHGIKGEHKIQKLLLGFSTFKNKALRDVKAKHEKIMDDLDYVAVMSKIKDKVQLIEGLEGKLEEKKKMLAEKRAEEGMSAEELREKYEGELLSTRVKDLVDRIVIQKQQLERAVHQQKGLQAHVDGTKVELAQYLYSQSNATSRKHGKRRVSRVANDGSMVFETDKDDEEDEQGALNERYLHSLSALETLLLENSQDAQKVVEAEKRAIELQEDVDRATHAEPYQVLLRLRASVELKEQHLRDVASRKARHLDEMRRAFGVTEETLNEAVKNELLSNRRARLGRRKERWGRLLDRMYRHTLSGPVDSGEGRQGKVMHRAVRSLSERNERLSRSVTLFLRDASLPSTSLQKELISRQSGAVPSPLFPPERAKKKGKSLQNAGEATAPSAAVTAMRSLNTIESTDSEMLLEDYGLQAAAEQLGVLDNLLRDGGKRHIEAAWGEECGGDEHSPHDMMEELVPQIRDAYRQSQKYSTQIKHLNKNLESLEKAKDDLRESFLRLIDGRDDMPRSTSARETEITFLDRRIPDLMAEMNVVREALEETERRREAAERTTARKAEKAERERSRLKMMQSGTQGVKTTVIKGAEVLEQVREEPSQVDQASSVEEAQDMHVVSTEKASVLTPQVTTAPAHTHVKARSMLQHEQQHQQQADPCKPIPAQQAFQGPVSVRNPSSSVTDAPLDQSFSRISLPKSPSQRSMCSSTSELTVGTADPFNTGLGEAPSWRLGTADTASGSMSMLSALEFGEESTTREKEYGSDQVNDIGASYKQREASFPVHVINLVVEGSTLNPNTLREDPPPEVARHEPFRLQPKHVQTNLHFGGHRTHAADLSQRDALAALAEQLPTSYVELQDAMLQGTNQHHWRVPSLPSTLPADTPLVAKNLKRRRARATLVRRTERLLEQLDAQRETRRRERRAKKEEAKAKDIDHRREDEEAGIVRVDSDDDDFGTLVIAPEEGRKGGESDEEDGYSSSSGDSEGKSSEAHVKDILSLRAKDKPSWVDRNSPFLGVDKDFAVYELERYRLNVHH